MRLMNDTSMSEQQPVKRLCNSFLDDHHKLFLEDFIGRKNDYEFSSILFPVIWNNTVFDLHFFLVKDIEDPTLIINDSLVNNCPAFL